MDLATLIKPILTTGELRVIGSTTHEEFKHIEKDRALARRLQRIAIDEPSVQETVRILQGLRSRYEAHHRVRFTDDALEAAAKLAARHLRDYKLPDSAIDVLDEAGARARLGRSAARAAQAAEAGAVGRREQQARAGAASGGDRSRRAAAGRGAAAGRDQRRRHRRSRGAHGPHSRQAGLIVRSRSAALARRSRSAAWCSARKSAVAEGRARDQTVARRPGSARSSGGLLPLHRADRGRQDRAGQAAGDPSRQRVHSLRHERVHGEARRGPADRRAARLRRLRAGRPAGRRHPPASLRGAAARRDREGARRHLQHPAAGDGSRDPHRQQRPQGRLPPGRADHDLERRLARDERRQHRVLGIGHATAPSTRAPRPRSSARSRRSRRCSAPSSATGSTRSSPSIRCRPG